MFEEIESKHRNVQLNHRTSGALFQLLCPKTAQIQNALYDADRIKLIAIGFRDSGFQCQVFETQIDSKHSWAATHSQLNALYSTKIVACEDTEFFSE